MNRPQKLPIEEVNPHLICVLCGGYLIDATTSTECLHSFCKTCILLYVETSRTCPICDTLIHKTRPQVNLRPDKTLQSLVYKLVPDLFQNEMKRRRDFYAAHPNEDSKGSPNASEERGEVSLERLGCKTEDLISLCLQHHRGIPPYWVHGSASVKISKDADRRYLLCPAAFQMSHIKKFISSKFALPPHYQIEVFHSDESLKDAYTLLDVAEIYTWKWTEPLQLFYVVYNKSRAEPRYETKTKVSISPEICDDTSREGTLTQPVMDNKIVSAEQEADSKANFLCNGVAEGDTEMNDIASLDTCTPRTEDKVSRPFEESDDNTKSSEDDTTAAKAETNNNETENVHICDKFEKTSTCQDEQDIDLISVDHVKKTEDILTAKDGALSLESIHETVSNEVQIATHSGGSVEKAIDETNKSADHFGFSQIETNSLTAVNGHEVRMADIVTVDSKEVNSKSDIRTAEVENETDRLVFKVPIRITKQRSNEVSKTVNNAPMRAVHNIPSMLRNLAFCKVDDPVTDSLTCRTPKSLVNGMASKLIDIHKYEPVQTPSVTSSTVETSEKEHLGGPEAAGEHCPQTDSVSSSGVVTLLDDKVETGSPQNDITITSLGSTYSRDNKIDEVDSSSSIKGEESVSHVQANSPSCETCEMISNDPALSLETKNDLDQYKIAPSDSSSTTSVAEKCTKTACSPSTAVVTRDLESHVNGALKRKRTMPGPEQETIDCGKQIKLASGAVTIASSVPSFIPVEMRAKDKTNKRKSLASVLEKIQNKNGFAQQKETLVAPPNVTCVNREAIVVSPNVTCAKNGRVLVPPNVTCVNMKSQHQIKNAFTGKMNGVTANAKRKCDIKVPVLQRDSKQRKKVQSGKGLTMRPENKSVLNMPPVVSGQSVPWGGLMSPNGLPVYTGGRHRPNPDPRANFAHILNGTSPTLYVHVAGHPYFQGPYSPSFPVGMRSLVNTTVAHRNDQQGMSPTSPGFSAPFRPGYTNLMNNFANLKGDTTRQQQPAQRLQPNGYDAPLELTTKKQTSHVHKQAPKSNSNGRTVLSVPSLVKIRQ